MTLAIAQLIQSTAGALQTFERAQSPLAIDVRAAIQSHLGRNVGAVADFLHLNPSLPTRELTGLTRVSAIEEALADRGLELLNIIYDLTMPIHEMAREGGGIGFRLGFLPRSIKIIKKPETLYLQQVANPVDTQALTTAIRRRYDAKSLDTRTPPQRDRLAQVVQLFDLYNSAIEAGDDARRTITRFKMNVHKAFAHDPTDNWVCLSDLIPLVFCIIEILDNHGVPWFEIPTNKKGYIARLISSDGTYAKVAAANGKPLVDGQADGVRTWADLIAKGKHTEVLPSVELYLLTLVIAPSLCHFGNLYDNHAAVERWLTASLGEQHNLIRIAGDAENSIPLGTTVTTTRHGHEQYSLLSVDAGIIPGDQLRSAIRRTASTANPAWQMRDFEHDLVQP